MRVFLYDLVRVSKMSIRVTIFKNSKMIIRGAIVKRNNKDNYYTKR